MVIYIVELKLFWWQCVILLKLITVLLKNCISEPLIEMITKKDALLCLVIPLL